MSAVSVTRMTGEGVSVDDPSDVRFVVEHEKFWDYIDEKLLKDDSSVSSAIGIKGNEIIAVPFEEAFNCKRTFNNDLYEAAGILSK